MNAPTNCRISAMLRSMLLAGVSVTALILHAPDAGADVPVQIGLGGLFQENALTPRDPVAALPTPQDAGRVGYFTPRVAGLRLGAAYAGQADPVCADGACGSGFDGFDLPQAAERPTDMLKLGADYASAVAGIDLSLRAGYGAAIGAASPAGDESWGLGASLGFAGFTVGAALLQDGERFNPTAIGGMDYVIGMVYTAPTWRAALQYADIESVLEADETLARNRSIGLEFSYTPSPQMTFSGGIQYGDVDDGRDRTVTTDDDIFLLFGTRIGF